MASDAVEEPCLGLDDRGRGVLRRVPRPEEARAVLALEADRADRQLRRSQRHRLTLGRVDDHCDDRLAVRGGREPEVHRLLRRLGHEVPVVPHCPLHADRGHDVGGDRLDRCQRNVVDGERSASPHRGALPPTRSRRRPVAQMPGCRHSAVRSASDRSLLRWPGREGRLGAQLDDGLGRRHPTVPGDVLGDEFVLLELDLAGAAGELGDQLIADADDLPLRVAVGAALAQFPLDAEVPA